MHITRQGDNCDALQLEAARCRSSHNGISLRRPLCTSVQIKQFRNLRSPILGIRWQGHVQNIEVTYQTGLPPVMEHVVYQTSQLFGHCQDATHCPLPAHQALHCQVELSLGRLPDSSWKRLPGRPNKRWLDQSREDNNRPSADVWRDAVRRGHFGMTQRSTPT